MEIQHLFEHLLSLEAFSSFENRQITVHLVSIDLVIFEVIVLVIKLLIFLEIFLYLQPLIDVVFIRLD